MSLNEWPLTRLFDIVLTTVRRNQFLNLSYRLSLALIQLWVSTWAVLWVSVFLYIVFYNLYIPSVSTTKELYIQYDSTCDLKLKSCQIPFAKVSLTEGRTPEFMRGQTYRFTIDLKLPESEVNWSQGMFMVRLTLFDQKHNIAQSVAKPTGLKYKSSALRGVFLLLYWPLYTMGIAEETQYISVDLITDFIEGNQLRVGSTAEARIEFEARDIQIYPPTMLTITAALTGLRYYMYYYRLTSFAMGTASISFFLYILTLIGYTKWCRSCQTDQQNLDNDKDNNEDLIGDVIEENNKEVEDSMDNENDDIKDNISEQIDSEFSEENECEDPLVGDPVDDLNESGLTGELSANESEASSTVVIPENEDEDSQTLPDSSSAET